MAEALPETVFPLQGRHAAWTTHSALGEFAVAQRHIERGLEVYDPERHPSSAFVYGGHDAGVCGYSSGALNDWALGHHDRALHLGQESVALAERLGHPFSLAHALCYRAILHQLRGAPEAVAEDVDRLSAHCAKHELRIWARNAEILTGWTMLVNGEIEEGLRQFREALEARRATRVTHRQPYYLALLAEALGSAGQPEQAIEAVTEAVELTDSTEDRRWEALVHRVRGDLLLVARPRNEADAEAALRRAIDVARGQEAKIARAACGDVARPPARPTRASGRKPATCSRRSTAGSPKASIRATSRTPKRCSTRWTRSSAHPPARARTAWRSTSAPSAQASGEAYSISAWLIPSLHGTKIIAVGTTRAM